MSDVATLIAIAIVVSALIVEKILNHKHVSELNDRLAAKNLEDFKYHKEIAPVELKHNKEVLEIQREEMKKKVAAEAAMTDAEREGRDLAKEF